MHIIKQNCSEELQNLRYQIHNIEQCLDVVTDLAVKFPAKYQPQNRKRLGIKVFLKVMDSQK